MGKQNFISSTIFFLIVVVDIQNYFASSAVLRNNGGVYSSNENEKSRNPTGDTIYVSVSSGNSSPTYSGNGSPSYSGNLTTNLMGSVGSGPSLNTGADQIFGAVSSYKPQISSGSSLSSSGPIQEVQQSQLINSAQQELPAEPISLSGGWTTPTEPGSDITIPTLVMETSLDVGVSAAVSSSHFESLYLEGDHENPAVANVHFGSDAHYGVFGHTVQGSSGDGVAFQQSEGNIDGGTSQMYEIMTTGELNELTLGGSSDAVGTGSLMQQSLSDIVSSENPLLQSIYQTPVEAVGNHYLQTEEVPHSVEIATSFNEQKEEEQVQSNFVDNIAQVLMQNSEVPFPIETDVQNDQEGLFSAVLQ